MALDNEIIFVSGQRGGGKSYWTKHHARSLPRCIIFDSLGEYQVDRRIHDIEEFVDFLIEDKNDSSIFQVAFDTHRLREDFPYFCRAVLARGNLYVIIEEVDLFCKPLSTDDEFMQLIKYGRHYGIQLIGVSRRPAEVGRDFTSNATRFINFVNREPSTVKYFRSLFGDHALDIPNLQKYHYLDVDFSEGDPTYDIRKPIGRKDTESTKPIGESGDFNDEENDKEVSERPLEVLEGNDDIDGENSDCC